MQSLWCTKVKLCFGLRASTARAGIVRAHETCRCCRAPCQHVLGEAVICPYPSKALFLCLCLGLSLIFALYLFSRSRVTCLHWWSPFFHTTNALWQQQLPPSKAFFSLQGCLINQVWIQSFSHIFNLILILVSIKNNSILGRFSTINKIWKRHLVASKVGP